MIQTPICSQTSLPRFAFALGCGQHLKGQGGSDLPLPRAPRCSCSAGHQLAPILKFNNIIPTQFPKRCLFRRVWFQRHSSAVRRNATKTRDVSARVLFARISLCLVPCEVSRVLVRRDGKRAASVCWGWGQTGRCCLYRFFLFPCLFLMLLTSSSSTARCLSPRGGCAILWCSTLPAARAKSCERC